VRKRTEEKTPLSLLSLLNLDAYQSKDLATVIESVKGWKAFVIGCRSHFLQGSSKDPATKKVWQGFCEKLVFNLVNDTKNLCKLLIVTKETLPYDKHVVQTDPHLTSYFYSLVGEHLNITCFRCLDNRTQTCGISTGFRDTCRRCLGSFRF